MSEFHYDASRTGLLLVDPYNDFLSDGGKLWPMVKDVADEVSLLDHQRSILTAARAAGILVFVVPTADRSRTIAKSGIVRTQASTRCKSGIRSQREAVAAIGTPTSCRKLAISLSNDRCVLQRAHACGARPCRTSHSETRSQNQGASRCSS